MAKSSSQKPTSARKRVVTKTPATKKRPARTSGATQNRALEFDPKEAVASLRSADPTLARAMDAVGPFALQGELRATTSVYAALAGSIVSQQLSGKAAATIYGRVCELFPGARKGPRPEQILSASDAMLRGAGLSQAKMRAMRDLAERSVAGEIPTLAAARRLSDDAIIERLTAVRGIGRWTAEMFLIFRLGRPDILPVDDFGVRKGFALAFGLPEQPKPKELAAYGERWAPFRTVASWYLWRTADRG